MNVYNLWLIYAFSDHVWFMGCYLFYGDFIYDLCRYAVILYALMLLYLWFMQVWYAETASVV